MAYYWKTPIQNLQNLHPQLLLNRAIRAIRVQFVNLDRQIIHLYGRNLRFPATNYDYLLLVEAGIGSKINVAIAQQRNETLLKLTGCESPFTTRYLNGAS